MFSLFASMSIGHHRSKLLGELISKSQLKNFSFLFIDCHDNQRLLFRLGKNHSNFDDDAFLRI